MRQEQEELEQLRQQQQELEQLLQQELQQCHQQQLQEQPVGRSVSISRAGSRRSRSSSSGETLD